MGERPYDPHGIKWLLAIPSFQQEFTAEIGKLVINTYKGSQHVRLRVEKLNFKTFKNV